MIFMKMLNLGVPKIFSKKKILFKKKKVKFYKNMKIIFFSPTFFFQNFQFLPFFSIFLKLKQR